MSLIDLAPWLRDWLNERASAVVLRERLGFSEQQLTAEKGKTQQAVAAGLAMTEKIRDLQAENEALKKQILDLQAQIAALNTERDELEKQAAALKKGGAVEVVRVRRSSRFSGL